MANKNQKKLFVALLIPSGVIQEIVRLQTILKNQLPIQARIPLPEHIHITVAFIGLVDPLVVDTVAHLLKTVKRNSLRIQLGPLGFFGAPQHNKVLYISILSDALVQFGNTIQHLLHKNGIVPLPGTYVPHITVARVKQVHDSEQLLNLIAHTQVMPVDFLVRDFYLMESVIHNGMLFHHAVNTYPLLSYE